MIKGLAFGLAAIAAAFAGGFLSTLTLKAPQQAGIPVLAATDGQPAYWDSGILVAPVIRDGTVAEYRTLNVILKLGPGAQPGLETILPDRLQEVYQELLLDPDIAQKMMHPSVNPFAITKNVRQRLTVALPDSDLMDVIVVHADRFAPDELRRNLIEDGHGTDVDVSSQKGAKTGNVTH
ncbi:MAG: hypothetical protein CMJ42_02555 [Phyllobacteriaceae bacterium]|nr:hypothetical protein [Phyllobacteriaceae bacterium]MBA93209.1 hypothetical protein [Phyllobacteriaceae bacterium]